MQKPWIIQDLFRRKPSLLKHLNPYHEHYLSAFSAVKEVVSSKVLARFFPELKEPTGVLAIEEKKAVMDAFIVWGATPHIKNPPIDLCSNYVMYIGQSYQHPSNYGLGYPNTHTTSTISQWCRDNPTFRQQFNTIILKALAVIQDCDLDLSLEYQMGKPSLFYNLLRHIIPRKYQNAQLVHDILETRPYALSTFVQDLSESETLTRLKDPHCKALYDAGGWQVWFPASKHISDINSLLGLMDSLGTWSADKIRQHVSQDIQSVEMTTLPDELSC